MFIDLYKPVLTINPTAGSTLGFKHSNEYKKLISQSRKGKPLSEATKKRLSLLFSGKLNPFWSKKHSYETKNKMSLSKQGSFNPMFDKKKSDEFIKHMFKDRTRAANTQFGVKKSLETLNKLRKKVYVYNSNKELTASYIGAVVASKELHISNQTINKYIDTGNIYKGKYFYSSLQ